MEADRLANDVTAVPTRRRAPLLEALEALEAAVMAGRALPVYVPRVV